MPTNRKATNGSRRPNQTGRGNGTRATYAGGTGGVRRGYATRLRYNPERKQQLFDYFLVLDFECTCEMGDKSWPHEIIEFPVCLLDLNTLEIVAEFHRYVRPIRNPTLTAFCRNLTGITQAQVDAAEPLPVVMKEFEQWYQKNVFERYLSPEKFPDPDHRKKVIFATDTISDINNFLFRMAAGRDKVHVPDYFREYIDIRATFHSYFKPKYKLKLPGMLREMRLRFQGTEHSGIDDTRNICYLIRAMIQFGCLFSHTNKIVGGITSDYHLENEDTQLGDGEVEAEEGDGEVEAEEGDGEVEAEEESEVEDSSGADQDNTNTMSDDTNEKGCVKDDENLSDDQDERVCDNSKETMVTTQGEEHRNVEENEAKTKVSESHHSEAAKSVALTSKNKSSRTVVSEDPIKVELKRQVQLTKEKSVSVTNTETHTASDAVRKTKQEIREEEEKRQQEEDKRLWALMEAARDSLTVGGGKGKNKQHSTIHTTDKAIRRSMASKPAVTEVKPVKVPVITTREFNISYSHPHPDRMKGAATSVALHHSTAIASSSALLASRARVEQHRDSSEQGNQNPRKVILIFGAFLLFLWTIWCVYMSFSYAFHFFL